MAKTKKKTYANVSIEMAQEASETYAQSSTSLARIEAKMNKEINEVKSKYQDEIITLKEAMEEPMEILEVFAREQKPNWGKKKSLELLHSTIGFRTGTPKVEKDKKFTWDGVAELIKNSKVFGPIFLRTKEEINKEAIIACQDEKILQGLQEKCFVRVVQEESFYVETKKEELVN